MAGHKADCPSKLWKQKPKPLAGDDSIEKEKGGGADCTEETGKERSDFPSLERYSIRLGGSKEGSNREKDL